MSEESDAFPSVRCGGAQSSRGRFYSLGKGESCGGKRKRAKEKREARERHRKRVHVLNVALTLIGEFVHVGTFLDPRRFAKHAVPEFPYDHPPT